MRSALAVEPAARASFWSLRLAAFGWGLAALALAASRWARLEPAAALSVFASALIFAAAAALASASAYVVIWREGASGGARATFGLLLASALLAAPIGFGVLAVRRPPLADVATDVFDPPVFSRSAAAARARGSEAPAEQSLSARQTARRAYPELRSLILDLEPDAAFRLVQNLVRRQRWRVVEERPPGGRLGRAQIEAVDKTSFFGFPVDVAIRLTPLVGQTRVDFRSAQRVGGHDFGAGARRWAAFAQALSASAETAR